MDIALWALVIGAALLAIAPFMRKVFNYEDHGSDEDLVEDFEELLKEAE